MPKTVTLELPYKPNPKQQQFHALSAKYRGFCGGWGNGKTSGGCAEFFIRLMEFPGTNSIIGRKTRPELRTTTWDMLVNGDTQPTGWRGIPKDLIRVYNKSDLYIELQNGSRIHGLPLDDVRKLENYNLGLYLVDQAEEVEEEFFIKLQGRLRQHGAPREGILLFNPNGHNWLWKRFIDPQRKHAWRGIHKCVEATPLDNPNLPPDYLEQFESLPEHWYNRYVLGSHDVFEGQIFVDWHDAVHVIDPFYIPKDWERWCSIDPGIGHEGAVNWVARDWNNNCYMYREIVKAGEPVDWWVDAITNAEASGDWGGPDEEIFVRLIGRESQQRAQTDGRSVYEIYAEEGMDDLELADRDPIARINRITQRLRPKVGHVRPQWAYGDADEEGITGDGAPSLYVFRGCEYTIEHLPQYRWRPVRTNFTEETPAEKPRKKDDHTIDNLGHILVAIGDSDPSVPSNSVVVDPDERYADEHFERALAAAAERQPVSGVRPGRVHTTVG